MPVSYILLGWLLTVITSLSSGALLFHFLKLRFSWPMAFILGACPVSLLVTLLGFSGLIYKGVFLAVFAGTLAACVRFRAWQSITPLQITERWFWYGFIPFALICFICALAPEQSPDGMAYHLHLTDLYYDAHAIVPIRHNMYASLSQGSEMLFLFAYSFGRHSAAALVHFTYLLSLALVIADYGSQKGWSFAGAFGGLVVFTTPIVAIDGVSAYNDVMIACIWFALFVLTDKFEPSRIIPAGMLAGFAYSVKYTAFLTIFFLIWQWRRHWKQLIPAGVAASVFILPWVLKNWLWVDNPFAPFFNTLFPNPYITADFEKSYSADMRTYGYTFGEVLWSNLISGDKGGGHLGFFWFLAPLGLIQTSWIFPALVFPLNIGARFLIPVLPFLALGIGRVLSRWRPLGISICIVHVILSTPWMNQELNPASWSIRTIPWEAALRLIQDDEYLNDARQEYRAARLLETIVPPGEQTYSFISIAESYTKRPVRSTYYSAENLEIRNILRMPLFSDLQPTLRNELKLSSPQKVIRIYQTGKGTRDVWSVSEIEPWPAKIRSSDAPFFLNRAMDGNPMTRWYSGDRLRPMWIELEYEETIPSVVLWMSRDQHSVQLSVDGGSVQQTNRQFSSPWPETRRWATETLRSMGIRYILLDEAVEGYRDYMDRAEEWNFEVAAIRGSLTLLRIR